MNATNTKTTERCWTRGARRWTIAKVVVLALASVTLLACGDFIGASGGLSGTGVTRGPITAFGSAFVTGVEWELDEASLELDGLPGDELDLRLGMVVRIEGTISEDGTRGAAQRIVFDDSVEGVISDDPVERVPGVERSFTVLGLTVVIHATETYFDDGASFEGLSRSDVVEVSGLRDADGAIRATRVELKGTFVADVSEAELRGVVSNLTKNPDGSGIFDLGLVTVRYSATTDFDDGLTRAALAEGDFVEAEGVLHDTDELTARKIELEDEGLGVEDADDAEIRGYVSNFTSLDQPFMVSGVPVDGSGATLSPPGFAIGNGVEVEVEGALVAGVLVAREIESEDEDDALGEAFRIDAEVTSVDTVSRSLVILGVTVEANGGTRIRDDYLDEPIFRFEDIRAGDWLEIEGRDSDGRAIADEIRRDDPRDDVILRGPVTAFDSGTPSLDILGQNVPLFAGTQYRDFDESPMLESEFFAAVQLDDIVKAEDKDAADLAVLGPADEVELED